MSGHTSAPWHIQESDSEHFCLIGSNGNGGIYIAKVQGPQNRANAKRIVRACNSHDELVELLRDALEIMDEQLSGDCPDMLAGMRAAIARATGETK